MIRTVLLFLSGFTLIPVALAAPRYERTINTGDLENSSPAFVAIPEAVTQHYALSALRILENDRVVALKASPTQKGTLGGIIADVTLCSVEGTGLESALHDGENSTSVRPDPLEDPENCAISVSFRLPVRVDAVSLDSDQELKTLSVAARGENGVYVTLRTVERVASTSFSSAMTDSLRITIAYDVVPHLRELTLNGELPARLLFQASPNTLTTLVYGDDDPPALPAAPASLFSTNATPYLSLSPEKMREEDDDGDGLPAAEDNCPAVANAAQEDRDSDGIGDACDNAPGIANAGQSDRDNDGVGDRLDNCPSHFNPDQRDDDLDGQGYVCDDGDGDGVINSLDNCPGLSNRDQQDLDGNHVGDACELDRDSDGIPDTSDTCRGFPNPGQEDGDDDGIGDACDSCPEVRNSAQEDSNDNGIGDACEAAIQDPDGDLLKNEKDNCPALSNADQKDADGDGRGDVCDNCPTLQNRDQRDGDDDGQGDVCTDADGDVLLPHVDNCPSLSNADQSDKDNDGVGDACEDDDGDGVANALDNCKADSNRDQADEDADGRGNICDQDDDRFSEKYPGIVWAGVSVLVLALLSLAVRMIVRIRKDQSTPPGLS